MSVDLTLYSKLAELEARLARIQHLENIETVLPISKIEDIGLVLYLNEDLLPFLKSINGDTTQDQIIQSAGGTVLVTNPTPGVTNLEVVTEDTPGAEVALWANCTLSGATVTVEAHDHIPVVTRLGAGLFIWLFDVDFGEPKNFTWSFNPGTGVDFIREISRTSTSVTTQSASETDPTGFFGIDVHGTTVSGSGSGGSGSGSSGNWWCVSYDDAETCGTDIPGGDCADADAASALVMGVTYGPFELGFPGLHWYRFVVEEDVQYHVTLTWIEGGDVGSHVFRGPCSSLEFWYTYTVSNVGPVGCGHGIAPADGMGYIMVSSATLAKYTVMVDVGPCP